MSTVLLKFTESPYFVPEEDNWHLKDDAPDDVKNEFEEYMRYSRELESAGVFI